MPKKILIIEDEKSLADSLNKKLTQEGFEVLRAEDGVSGLDMAFQNEPDLILLDIIMPKMNGKKIWSGRLYYKSRSKTSGCC